MLIKEDINAWFLSQTIEPPDEVNDLDGVRTGSWRFLIELRNYYNEIQSNLFDCPDFIGFIEDLLRKDAFKQDNKFGGFVLSYRAKYRIDLTPQRTESLGDWTRSELDRCLKNMGLIYDYFSSK